MNEETTDNLLIEICADDELHPPENINSDPCGDDTFPKFGYLDPAEP